MGKLVCTCCKEEVEAKTFTEADNAIDHARGESRGRKCDGNPSHMTWNDKPLVETKTLFTPDVRKQAESIDTKPEKPKPKPQASTKPKGSNK